MSAIGGKRTFRDGIHNLDNRPLTGAPNASVFCISGSTDLPPFFGRCKTCEKRIIREENLLCPPGETDDGRHKLVVGVPLKVARIKPIREKIAGQAVQHGTHLG